MLFRSQSCRFLTVDSDSDNTTLNVYEYSEGITFGIPSGYTEQKLNCDPNNAYIKMDQYEMIGMPDILPCSGIKVICNVTDECLIEYGNSSTSLLRYYQPFFNCYGPLYLRETFPIMPRSTYNLTNHYSILFTNWYLHVTIECTYSTTIISSNLFTDREPNQIPNQ